MGQAKRRGTFEQRCLAAEAKAELVAKERQRKFEEAEAAMTPEQKEQRTKARNMITALVGLGLGSGSTRWLDKLRSNNR